MLTTFYSTVTSGHLGLVQLHGGRGLILHGIIGVITGGATAVLTDPFGDFVYGSSDATMRLSLRDYGARVFELTVTGAPATASWMIFYRLW